MAGRRRTATRVIGVLWVLGGLLPFVAIALAFTASGALPPLPEGTYGPDALGPFLVLLVLLFVPLAFVGASLAARPRSPPIGWVMLVVAALNGVGSFASVYATKALVLEPGTLPAGEAAAVLTAPQNMAQVLVGLLGVSMLPTGRLPAGRARWVLAPAVVVAGLSFIGHVLAPGPLFSFGHLDNPVALTGDAGAVADAVELPPWAWPPSLAPVALWLLWVARREPQPGRRRVFRRVGAMTLFIPFGYVTLVLAGARSAGWLVLLAFLVVIVDVTVFAARRERLWGMPSLVHRAVLWVVCSAVVATGYGATVLVALAAGADVARWERVAALAVGIGAAALAYSELDRRLRRRIVGEGEDPLPALERLHSELEAHGVRDAPQVVAEAAGRAVRGAAVAVDLAVEGRQVRVAHEGRAAGGERLAIPVVHEREAIGVVAVLLPEGDELGDGERQLLAAIVADAAPALDAWRLAHELELSRGLRESVAAGERDDVARVLAPGLIGRLERMSGDLRALDALDPEAGDARLAQLHAEARELVDDVRSLAHTLAGAPPAQPQPRAGQVGQDRDTRHPALDG